jgi:hypothetical protein
MFTAIGADTLAYFKLSDLKGITYRLGCVSVCLNPEGLVNGSCTGIGCCQTAIPSGMNYYSINFDKNFNNSRVSNFSRCSYAVLMEEKTFQFSTSYICHHIGLLVSDQRPSSNCYGLGYWQSNLHGCPE